MMVRMIQKKIGKCLLLFMVVVGIALASRDTSEAASEEMVAFEDYLGSIIFLMGLSPKWFRLSPSCRHP